MFLSAFRFVNRRWNAATLIDPAIAEYSRLGLLSQCVLDHWPSALWSTFQSALLHLDESELSVYLYTLQNKPAMSVFCNTLSYPRHAHTITLPPFVLQMMLLNFHYALFLPGILVQVNLVFEDCEWLAPWGESSVFALLTFSFFSFLERTWLMMSASWRVLYSYHCGFLCTSKPTSGIFFFPQNVASKCKCHTWMNSSCVIDEEITKE